MLNALELDCQREAQRIVDYIRQQLHQSGHSRMVLGLSGGIDSALVAYLGVQAVGAENVKAMVLPYATSNPQSEADANLVAAALGIPCERFDITGMVAPLLERYPDMSAGRLGNAMARARMIVLFDQSVLFRGLVVGTSNRTETLLGYFTMHGDGAAAFKPLAHLYKCQVRALSRWVGVPEPLVTKAPSADLWQGQTDEGELCFCYDEADQVLYLLTEERRTIDEIAAQGFDRRIVECIERRMLSTDFKRHAPAILPTVAEARG
ncbi:MAG: NAD+ synthase [Chloroflexi bacterium]|nr:NAD+ synthase [Chloroflexota bacterium]